MNLEKIVAISGKPGLFKICSRGAGNLIVESIADGKRFPTFAHDKISSLEEICIYTTGEDRPLKDVFVSIHEKMGDDIGFDPKKATPLELREKFLQILPDYDEDAVYPSDMKKVFQWYTLLNSNGVLDYSSDDKKEENNEEKPVEEKPVEKKPAAKKTTTVKKPAVKETANTKAAGAAKRTKASSKV